MKEYEIRVFKKHISEGKKFDARANPIALAIKDVVKEYYEIEVLDRRVFFYKFHSDTIVNELYDTAILPLKVGDFLNKFNESSPEIPHKRTFKFNLNIEENKDIYSEIPITPQDKYLRHSVF